MIIQFEISGPFRLRPMQGWIGGMWRGIWLWFSVAIFPRGGINDMFRAFRWEAEQEVAERTEDLVRLARAAMPDNMGGTPDLFCPEGYEHCEEPWEAWQEDMQWAIRQIPKDPTASPQAGTAQEPQPGDEGAD